MESWSGSRSGSGREILYLLRRSRKYGLFFNIFSRGSSLRPGHRKGAKVRELCYSLRTSQQDSNVCTHSFISYRLHSPTSFKR